jgi:hypothetical protein
MGVIRGGDIDLLKEFLSENGIQLFHACGLNDFTSFIKVGGVASRALLDSHSLPFTTFTSDHTDRMRGLWGKVFFNFSDAGEWFHRGSKSVPNVYGPISLSFSAAVLKNARDISVTLTSVTGQDFDRERDSLSLEDVQKLFAGNRLLTRAELQTRFPGRRIMTPEINVTFEGEEILAKSSFDGLGHILCDPIPNLASTVEHLSASLNIVPLVRKTSQEALFLELINCALSATDSEDALRAITLGTDHAVWLDAALNLPPARGFMLKNYLTYLREGTLVTLLNDRDEAITA